MNDNKDTNASSSQSTEENKQGESQQTMTTPEWSNITGGKFKSETELAKSYKELEKKHGEQSEEVRKTREFAETVNPLLEEIRNDPELFKKLDEKLRKRGESSDNSNKDSQKTADNTEIREVAESLLLAEFEGKHGINKLSQEEQKTLRTKIGNKISELTGTTMSKVDLRRLSSVLENAYVLATKDDKKSESEAEESDEGDGAMSSISSSKGKGEVKLTPDQARAAEKLGLSREQYVKGMK